MAVEHAGSCCCWCWSGGVVGVDSFSVRFLVIVPLHNLHYYHLHLLAMCQRVQRKDIPSISPFSWSPLKALSGPLSPFTILSYLILPFISSALGFHLLLCQATLSLPARCSPYPVCHTFIIYVPFFLAVIATSQRPPTITTSKDKSIMLLFVQEGQIHVTSISWAMHLRNSMNDKLIWVWVLEWAVCHEWVFKKLKILGSHQERRIIVWQSVILQNPFSSDHYYHLSHRSTEEILHQRRVTVFFAHLQFFCSGNWSWRQSFSFWKVLWVNLCTPPTSAVAAVTGNSLAFQGIATCKAALNAPVLPSLVTACWTDFLCPTMS